MQITDRSVEDKTMPLLRLGFRPFFLLGSAYAAWALLRWILILSGVMGWSHALPITAWHSHELLFGFAMAIVVGFLTTAVQNWTGSRGINGAPLLGLVSLWLAARVTINLYPDTLIWVLCDALFIILAASVVAKQLIRANNRKNLIFIPVFILFLLLHLYQSWAMSHDVLQARHIGFATIWLMAVLVSLIGSRVIPFFIERRLTDTLPRDNLPLLLGAQGSLIALAVMALLPVPALALQWVAALGLVFHGARALRWYRQGIWQEPLLWSLYLSYLCLPVSLVLLAVSGLGHYSQVMHLVSVGFVSSMIMAMMCRVSLGHTGRLLKAHPLAVVAMASMLVAAVSRVALPWIEPSWLMPAYHLAATCWLVSLLSFLWVYAPMFVSPRADGQIG